MARLALEHFADVGERTPVFLFQVIERGAPVPGLDVIRLDLDDAVEKLDRQIGLLGLDRGAHAQHQQIGRVAARDHPELPDALLDGLGGFVVGRRLQRAEQEIDILGAVAARRFRQKLRLALRRLKPASRLRAGGVGKGGQGQNRGDYRREESEAHGRRVISPPVKANIRRWRGTGRPGARPCRRPGTSPGEP